MIITFNYVADARVFNCWNVTSSLLLGVQSCSCNLTPVYHCKRRHWLDEERMKRLRPICRLTSSNRCRKWSKLLIIGFAGLRTEHNRLQFDESVISQSGWFAYVNGNTTCKSNIASLVQLILTELNLLITLAAIGWIAKYSKYRIIVNLLLLLLFFLNLTHVTRN